ncbi:glycosyltransferase family 2 protein [Thermincola ferriacetica]|uniref:glycosyltransferase family 2 protein n=1 Tax=Thermincola ferriacetica TaxID=281456 RepID=UPI001364A31F|nr:glycosyltransferase family 2 protein [Thermincola ferriacetica]
MFASEDINTQYQKWIHKRKAYYSEKPFNCSVVPVIGIMMPVNYTEHIRIQDSVKSILAQDSPYWHLYLVTDDPTELGTKESLVKQIKTDKRISIIWRSGADVAGIVKKMTQVDYVLFMDVNDRLSSEAVATFQKTLIKDRNLDLIYADEDTFDGVSGQRFNPVFKPGWSPHLLLSFNYIGHPVVLRKELLEKVGKTVFFSNNWEYRILLSLTNLHVNAKRIPEMLCSRISPADFIVNESEENHNSGYLAIKEALSKKGLHATVRFCPEMGIYATRLGIKEKEKISIIIPTKDNGKILQGCLESILEKSSYDNYEILIIDNGSTDESTLIFLADIKKFDKIRVLSYLKEFNYPLVNNFGAANAAGKHLVFLNDDTKVISSDWLEALLEYSQMQEVGAVGALLLFPNGLIQHAGIVIGMRGSASHAFYKYEADKPGYLNLIQCVRNVSAVTAACMMIKAETFAKVGGFDPRFRLGMNDVDLCLRLLKMGLYNVYTPYAKLIHYESLTRNEYVDDNEIEMFKRLHCEFISNGDPYYHPELSLERNDYSLAI